MITVIITTIITSVLVAYSPWLPANQDTGNLPSSGTRTAWTVKFVYVNQHRLNQICLQNPPHCWHLAACPNCTCCDYPKTEKTIKIS